MIHDCLARFHAVSLAAQEGVAERYTLAQGHIASGLTDGNDDVPFAPVKIIGFGTGHRMSFDSLIQTYGY